MPWCCQTMLSIRHLDSLPTSSWPECCAFTSCSAITGVSLCPFNCFEEHYPSCPRLPALSVHSCNWNPSGCRHLVPSEMQRTEFSNGVYVICFRLSLVVIVMETTIHPGLPLLASNFLRPIAVVCRHQHQSSSSICQGSTTLALTQTRRKRIDWWSSQIRLSG